jgi:hypothetical protein
MELLAVLPIAVMVVMVALQPMVRQMVRTVLLQVMGANVDISVDGNFPVGL